MPATIRIARRTALRLIITRGPRTIGQQESLVERNPATNLQEKVERLVDVPTRTRDLGALERARLSGLEVRERPSDEKRNRNRMPGVHRVMPVHQPSTSIHRTLTPRRYGTANDGCVIEFETDPSQWMIG
jgi:hypothetical protein